MEQNNKIRNSKIDKLIIEERKLKKKASSITRRIYNEIFKQRDKNKLKLINYAKKNKDKIYFKNTSYRNFLSYDIVILRGVKETRQNLKLIYTKIDISKGYHTLHSLDIPFYYEENAYDFLNELKKDYKKISKNKLKKLFSLNLKEIL
jgi:hypothetical protein